MELAWPAPTNTGHVADPGDTLRFRWSGTHSAIQVAYWDSRPSAPGWPNALWSGAPSPDGTFDWNIGIFPCGYRPGLYYFSDQDNPVNGVVAVSITDPEGRQDHYDPRPCSELADGAPYDPNPACR